MRQNKDYKRYVHHKYMKKSITLGDVINVESSRDYYYFPEHWTEGVIVPVHNKGDCKNVHNYREVTLVSCLSKLFMSILNDRITQVCDRHTSIML